MNSVLIVEDEVLVALDLQATLEELGFGPVDLAYDLPSALETARRRPDGAHAIALVDVNLADGPTGPIIGSSLATDHGTAVIFLTANPQSAQAAAAGLGIVSKPVDRAAIEAVATYAAAVRSGAECPPPPDLIPLRRAPAG